MSSLSAARARSGPRGCATSGRFSTFRWPTGSPRSRCAPWGLFVSRAIDDGEPAVFNEPALFLIRPDGTVCYESILSMPVGRPRLDDLLGGSDYWTANDYPPARGEA